MAMAAEPSSAMLRRRSAVAARTIGRGHASLAMQPLLAGASGLASLPRPALRLGGEWAGWRCAFHPRTGALITKEVERYSSEEMIEWGQVPGGFEECTTETWQEDSSIHVLSRRSVMLLPEDGCNTENLAAVVKRLTLPTAVSGPTSLTHQATLDVDVLNARAWALDDAGPVAGEADGTLWRCESVFDGLGGERPRVRSGARECPVERTRVACAFDPATGALADKEPVLVWQARCGGSTAISAPFSTSSSTSPPPPAPHVRL